MEKALFQLSEKLRHPSDLQTKLNNIEKETRNKYEFHNNTLSKFISGAYSKILNISENVSDLDEHLKNFIKNKNKNVDVLQDFFSLVKDYKSVKMICIAHSNLCKVNEFSERLKTINDPPFNENLKIYHTNVYESENFRYQLELYNVDISRDEYIEVTKAINIIERNCLEFLSKLLEICEDFVENYEMMKDVVEIVEKEEKRDDITRKSREGEKSDNPMLKEIYKMNKEFVNRKPNNYKEKVVKAIKTCIKKKFKKLADEDIFVNKMDFILKDLKFIKEHINFKFYNFDDILADYHKNLKAFLDENTERCDAGEILALVEYADNYYRTIESKFNKIADALGEPLLANETELLEKYSEMVVEKLKEWITNITRMEVEKFKNRNEEISKDEDNKLISPGFINLLQIIRMQLEPIAFNKRIFAHITKTVRRNCEDFKEELINAMEEDFLPSCEMKSKAGYEDFCIMFGNSGLKVTQYITSLPQCQSEEVKELANIFLDILKASNTYLSEFIIFTCQPAIDKIFTEEWYRDNVMSIVILTLDDFLSDYKITMGEYSFITFVHEVSTAITLAYMKQITRKRAIISEICGGKLKSDHSKLLSFFTKYGDEADIEKCLSPLLKIIPLIESRNDDLFVVEVKSLKMVYPDIKKSFVKNIIKKRSDLSSEEKKLFLERTKECFADIVSKEKTIFSRIFNI